MGQCICAPCKKDWAVRVVFAGEEVYSSLAKDFQFSEPRAGEASIPLKRRSSTTCLLLGSVCPAHALPSASADCSVPTQEGRSPACRVTSRRDRPGVLCMTPQTCLSERTSTWCPRMSGRKNWQAWHTASISKQLMCRVDSSSAHRSKVGLPLHSAPQPLLEASVVTTFLLCAVSRVTPCFSQRGFFQRVRAFGPLFLGYRCKQSSAALINCNDTVFPWLSP